MGQTETYNYLKKNKKWQTAREILEGMKKINPDTRLQNITKALTKLNKETIPLVEMKEKRILIEHDNGVLANRLTKFWRIKNKA